MVRSLFPLCVMFLCCRVEGWERQIVGAGEKKKQREVEPAAQFESLSAAGFFFPLPLLSVCFVSSFVRLCLDSERVHAARHVIALCSSSRAFSHHSACILHTRETVPVRQHIYVESRALGCFREVQCVEVVV